MNPLTQHISGVGRAELEERYQLAIKEIASLMMRSAYASAEHDRLREQNQQLTANLTSVQKHCTKLLLRVRAEGELEPLAEALARARQKYPKGCYLAALVSEVGEVATASYREGLERCKVELLDVAVVAMRLYLGEVDRDTPQVLP